MRWLPLICAGVVLAVGEAGWLFGRAYGLFFSASERLLVTGALAVMVLGTVLSGWLLAPSLVPSPAGARARRVWIAGAALYGLSTAILLTEGRRVRDQPLRPLMIVLAAVFVAALVASVVHLARRARAAELQVARLCSVGLQATALLALVVDARVLVRGYPAFHVAALVWALVSSALAGLVWPSSRTEARRWRGPALAASTVLALGALVRVAQHPNVGFIVREHGVFSAKLVALVPISRAAEESEAPDPSARPAAAAEASIDLRDRDVLIVTVDALRADTLRAYGGHGLTPHMDAFAAESVVFERAYTPAPHTSYALASLLTGKFVKPVAELSRAAHDHVTLPDLLRRYGYRTAAFYPPAIFFVDGARFAPLHERAFGFEYLKEMYASAELRVTQLAEYLEHADSGHPVFIWIHLFEPHEPYDPPAGWPHMDSARGRYDGEVAEADRAFGRLVALFRGKKPRGTVILAADHGEEFGEHGGSFHGTTLYDEQARIPLVWSSPESVGARKSLVPVELVDVGSTILATAGIPRDPRMRGDDLSAALAGDDTRGPSFAFSSVDDRTMITDGRLKAVCAAREPHCQLFDLVSDPGETRSQTASQAADAQRLRSALDAFLRSIPGTEALSMDEGVAFPEVLARAELGVIEALPEVVGLLDDARPAVRAKAARLLGEHSVASAAPALSELAQRDPDPDVRAEAAIAALALGQVTAREDVRRALAGQPERATRAALVLGLQGDATAVDLLGQLVRDSSASEVARALGVDALAHVRDRRAVDALVDVLGEPRLGVRAADALREGHSVEAADPLARSLATQRYPDVRGAEARALFAFNDPRALPLSLRFLGMETSLPRGIALLDEYGVFAKARPEGGSLTQRRLRRGAWACGERSCEPGQGAELLLVARTPGTARLVTAVSDAPAGALLRVGRHEHTLHGGAEELSTLLDARESRGPALPVSASAGVTLSHALLVHAEPEIPPPAPEPWQADAGVNEAPRDEH